jgi:signal transduction histidine kinase
MKKNAKTLQFFHSLKFRLILLVLIAAILPGTVLCVGILNSYESRAISIRESEVLSQAKILANKISTSSYMGTSTQSTEALQAQMDLLTTIYDGRVIIVNDVCKIIYDTYNIDLHRIIISEEVIRCFSGTVVMNYDSENHYIEMTIPIINPDDSDENVLGVMLVSVSTDNITLNLIYLRRVATIIFVIVATITAFFGIVAVVYLMVPFKKLSTGISSISTGYGSDSLEVFNYTETARICESFNETIAQMRVMDESRQEFVSNVSHELKTPMTSMKVLADSINSMPDAPKEMYQEFMEDITNEIERENKIITDLLSLVKMDKSAADLNITTVNMNDLLEQILKRLQPIADKQQVELVLESFRPITAEVDEVKLTLAITNLVENGIKYNRSDATGWVHVSINADYQYFYLKIEDNGIGIPEDSLDHIYERFYRVDKSHSREIGGTGLGLAITRSSILMHRGAIKVYSVLGEGTTFDVRIPLNYIA